MTGLMERKPDAQFRSKNEKIKTKVEHLERTISNTLLKNSQTHYNRWKFEKTAQNATECELYDTFSIEGLRSQCNRFRGKVPHDRNYGPKWSEELED